MEDLYFAIHLYLGVLGTFAEEKDDEEIAYGLVFPINSWDAIYTQVRYIFASIHMTCNVRYDVQCVL